MTNNDIFKKLRVALQLRDDQIVSILELVDFRISKGEIGNFFRNENHPKYMECGDQILRNFLNGLVIYLRGTKENPKIPGEVLLQNKKVLSSVTEKKNQDSRFKKDKPNNLKKTKGDNPLRNVKFNNGKHNKKSE